MIKGIQKYVIMLPLSPKSRFECAYFIVRRGAVPEAKAGTEQELAGMEMLAEAGRILQDSGVELRARRKRGRKAMAYRCMGAVLLFLAGVGVGLLLSFLWSRGA